jgi:anti-sigma factor RsiW
VTCENARSLIHAYVDGELDLVRSLEIEEHLRGCDPCTREAENVRALHTVISEGVQYHHAPARLEARVRAAMRNEYRAQGERDIRFPRFGWGLITAAAAVALIAVIVKGRMPTVPAPIDITAREVVADHIRSMMANHLTDVLSSDQHTVKPWFDGKIDFAPEVEDFGRQGFILIGGRLDYLDNRPVAAIVYHRAKHVINLFVWPVSRPADSASVTETRQGYNIVHWTKSGMAYWAVSDLNLAELEKFARMMREAKPQPGARE